MKFKGSPFVWVSFAMIVGVASSMLTTSATMGLSQLSRAGQMQRVAMVTGFLVTLY